MIAKTNGVELWHLVVAILGLGVLLGSTFGTVIWSESRQQTTLEEQVRQIKADSSYTRRRQEINEDRISKLETEAALTRDFEVRMTREHADIYQAIRGQKR